MCIKKQIIFLGFILIFLFQIAMPIFATEDKTETEEIDNPVVVEDAQNKEIENTDTAEESQNEDSADDEDIDNTEKMTNEELDNSEKNEIEDEILEDTTNKGDAKEDIEDTIELDTEEIKELDEESPVISINEVMLMSASAVSDMYVGNEAEFRNALANQASVIHVRQSIDFGSSVNINYPVTIINEGPSNSLRYGSGGNFIVVKSGGSLTITGMVVDTRSSGVGGMTAINIQSGGTVTFNNSSIVDGGLSNTGILVSGGATLNLWSCEIVYCNYGINLQYSGKINFLTQEGRGNNFYYNTTALFIDNFSGSVALNQNISMHDNTTGIQTSNVTGTVNVSAGNYYSNTRAIYAGGNIKVSGGSFYSNTDGIYTNPRYSGKLTMTGGSIYSNSQFAIYHSKTNDGGCTITGGSISGAIYLAQNDNYINTNTSYPSFTVTPSSYYFKRKLVKTNSNAYAKNEISKVTMTPRGSWYKYVEADSEYIVIWSGGNVIVRCKDYDGKIIKEEIQNGTIGTSYSITAPSISGYDLVDISSNTTGTYAINDIVVEFKYDLVNVAKVNYEDLLSGIVSARYWYNADSQSFNGDGTSFEDGKVFEDYGYYRVVVVNGVGLEKELTFTLNKDSYKR